MFEMLVLAGIGVIVMWFMINKFVVEGNNPYAFTQYFDKSLVNVKMYEVSPSSYNEQVTKPNIRYRGIGKYGKEGLYHKNLYPVNKDFFIPAESNAVHFYYKSGGQKSIVPLLMAMFYTSSSEEAAAVGEGEEQERIFPVGKEPSAGEILEEVDAEYEHPDKKAAYKDLAFLVPAKEQLELMTDNYVDNFLTRQQSIALQAANNMDILTKAIVPIGLFAIISLVLFAIAMTFASEVTQDGIDAATGIIKTCPEYYAQHLAPTTTAVANGSSVFTGLIPGVN
jgi:hypothetical protein